MQPAYTCPVCGEKVSRDLVVFLQHTDQHIIEKIKQKHPEWVAEDGLCQKCLEYYRDALRGSTFKC